VAGRAEQTNDSYYPCSCCSCCRSYCPFCGVCVSSCDGCPNSYCRPCCCYSCCCCSYCRCSGRRRGCQSIEQEQEPESNSGSFSRVYPLGLNFGKAVRFYAKFYAKSMRRGQLIASPPGFSALPLHKIRVFLSALAHFPTAPSGILQEEYHWVAMCCLLLI